MVLIHIFTKFSHCSSIFKFIHCSIVKEDCILLSVVEFALLKFYNDIVLDVSDYPPTFCCRWLQ